MYTESLRYNYNVSASHRCLGTYLVVQMLNLCIKLLITWDLFLRTARLCEISESGAFLKNQLVL